MYQSEENLLQAFSIIVVACMAWCGKGRSPNLWNMHPDSCNLGLNRPYASV